MISQVSELMNQGVSSTIMPGFRRQGRAIDTVELLYELQRSGGRLGLVTMCIGEGRASRWSSSDWTELGTRPLPRGICS